MAPGGASEVDPAASWLLTVLRTLQIVGLVCAAVVQWQLVAIPALDAESFDRSATELERTDTWRYGYVVAHHGALLVKARRLPSDPPTSVDEPGDRLSAVMRRELHTVVWKGSLELLFYAALVALYRLRRRAIARVENRGFPARAAIAGLSAAVFVTAVLSPYLITGYGEPLFSTWRGPGALSYSGLVPANIAFGASISYRTLLEALLLYPMVAFEWALAPLASLGARMTLWVAAVAFYAIAAIVVQ